MERTGINGLAATLQTAGSLHYQCIDILVHLHPATVDPVHQLAKISESAAHIECRHDPKGYFDPARNCEL
jgi:hypothetical protein